LLLERSGGACVLREKIISAAEAFLPAVKRKSKHMPELNTLAVPFILLFQLQVIR